MTPETISSLTNERIKRLVRLRKRRDRESEEMFVVEGRREIERGIAAGHRPLEVYQTASTPLLPTDNTFICSAEVMEKASYRSDRSAVIAVFESFSPDIDAIDVMSESLFLMIEGLEKPGNLGAILRVADAAGAEAVLMVGSHVDLFNPNVIRASTGAVFTVPTASRSLHDHLTWLRDRDVTVVAAHPGAPTAFWKADLSPPVAVLVGSEAHGLSPSSLAGCDVVVSIPMLGMADSLNAAITMSLLAYEVRRQHLEV